MMMTRRKKIRKKKRKRRRNPQFNNLLQIFPKVVEIAKLPRNLSQEISKKQQIRDQFLKLNQLFCMSP